MQTLQPSWGESSQGWAMKMEPEQTPSLCSSCWNISMAGTMGLSMVLEFSQDMIMGMRWQILYTPSPERSSSSRALQARTPVSK